MHAPSGVFFITVPDIQPRRRLTLRGVFLGALLMNSMKSVDPKRFMKSGVDAGIYLLVLGLIFFYAVSAHCLSSAQKKSPGMEEKLLATVPEGYGLGQVLFSTEGRKVAFSATKNSKWYVFADGTRGNAYDYVRDITFSRDGKRIAYSARKGSKENCVVDGKEGRPFDTVCNPTITRDGSVIVFEASVKNQFFIAAAGGGEGPRRDMSVVRPVFSRDGRRMLYILSDDEKRKVTAFIADSKTGRVLKTRNYGMIHGVSVSADGSRLAYGAVRRGKHRVVVQDFTGKVKESPAYERAESIVFSPDGKQLAWVAEQQGKQFVIVSSIAMKRFLRGPPFTGIGKPVFSPNGTYLLYTAVSGKKTSWMLQPLNIGAMEGAVKQTEDPETPRALSIDRMYDTVDSAVFSPDGSYFACRGTRNGKYYLVLRNVRNGGKEEQKSPAYDLISNIIVSTDGRHVAWLAKQKERFFVVVRNVDMSKARRGPRYDKIWSPRFSPDGRQVLYGARSGRELWWKVEPID